jgi:alpha,alpha-trehalase
VSEARTHCLRAVTVLFLLLLGAAQALAPAGSVPPEPPETLFGDLFVAVQSAAVFSDGKTFVDAVPKFPPAQILASYRKAAPRSPAELRNFVEVNFDLPPPPPTVVALPEDLSIAAHIDALWAHLTRTSKTAPPYSSLLPLPTPYVVPGGRFREIYYWDSYFTMLGLADSGRQDLVLDMVGDFAYLIDAYGYVPNGTRTYYLSRSQPPFFYAMTELVAPEAPVKGFARYLRELEHEHEFWMDGAAQLRPGDAHRRALALRDGALLNRYWDDRDTPRDESYREDTELARVSGRPPGELYRDIRAAAESGWDFSTRWFADPKSRGSIMTTDIVPVDLNSLLFGLEQAIAAGCRERGDSVCGRNFSAASEARRTAVTRCLWDERRGVFLDYHRSAGTRLPGLSAATLYPLFVGLATPAQAHRVAAAVRRELLRPGGLVTTPVTSGHEQWDAPNGWAPLQWIAIAGLRRYGEENLAAVIACRFMASVEGVYRSAGKLVEKYDVVNIGRGGGGGEYPLQDGFGWTNGVMRHLLTLYPKFADVKYSDCPQ